MCAFSEVSAKLTYSVVYLFQINSVFIQKGPSLGIHMPCRNMFRPKDDGLNQKSFIS